MVLVVVIFTQIYFSSFLAGGECSKDKRHGGRGTRKAQGPKYPIPDRLTELGFVTKTV